MRKYTLKTCQEIAIAKGGQCLALTFINVDTKMPWQCEAGHIWSAIFYHINKGHWCPYCAGVVSHTIEQCQDFALLKGGRCISIIYINAHTKMEWECDQGHRWLSTFHKIKSAG